MATPRTSVRARKKKAGFTTRFIFVCGGVMSGIGKGITVASTARILKDYGFRVSCVKIDPYLNVDAGTMNPTEHGEVFVTDDGMETDQDIGNYERFMDQDVHKGNYMTQGQVYLSVIQKERALEYKGKCVEPYPHILEEVEGRLRRAARASRADFLLVEIGGTVGEYQNALFLETARLMKHRQPGRVLVMLVSYFPVPAMLGEMKTKPTQTAVRSMQAMGVQPDVIIARASVPLDRPRKEKVAMFCNVQSRDIISAPDITSIYDVPGNFEKDHLGRRILDKFGLKPQSRLGPAWRAMVRRMHGAKAPVRVGIVGKYFGTGDFTLSDSYISVIESIKHAAWSLNRKPQIEWLGAQEYEKDPKSVRELEQFDAVIVPGGFGSRGVEGKIAAIRHCRQHGIPFLGLCYGMQLATIEFARTVAGLKGAHTTEVDPATKHPVITTMTEQLSNIQDANLGGTMRLGAYDCRLAQGTLSRRLYGAGTVSERHRHRYEFNNAYREKLAARGLRIAGVNPARDLVEIIELADHPFFVGTQFHPELKGRPLSPHPLFVGLLRAALERKAARR